MQNTLSKIWKNRNQIMEGIKNSIIRDQFVEQVSRERYKICNTCPDKDVEGKECAVPKTNPCCALCGCSLSFKTRALSADCPAGKWTALITEEDEDELEELN